MKHLAPLSRTAPRAASTIETQQKVAIVSAAIEAFAALGEAIGVWLGLFGGGGEG